MLSVRPVLHRYRGDERTCASKCRSRLRECRPEGGDSVGDGGHPIIAGSGAEEGAVDADVGHDTGDDEVTDVLAAQCQVEPGSKKLVVVVAMDDEFFGELFQFVNHIR